MEWNDKLVLGTVQFGLKYGINNSEGKPTEKDVFEILDLASELDIETLETANAYGNAIELIGLYHQHKNNLFKILSKFKNVKAGKLYDLTQHSLDKLHIPYFDVYSYHSFDNYIKNTYLADELLSLKSKGIIKKIGISVYSNNELKLVIGDNAIDVIQLPYNLLDNQNRRGIYLELAKPNHKEIHVRSVFLQGLFFMNEESIPEKLVPLKPYLREIHSFCIKEAITIQSLALSYAVYNKQIDRVLIGVDNKVQLLKNIESLADLKNAFDSINQLICVNEKELLNPVIWK